MRCPLCGAFNVGGVTLCQKCGATLKYIEEPLSLSASPVVTAGREGEAREELTKNKNEDHCRNPEAS